MKLTLLRNATMRIEYAGTLFLTDPCFAPKHSRPSFAGKSANPTSELPVSPAAAIEGARAVLISHLHSDHFDPTAQELIPKELPVICQPWEQDALRSMGFKAVLPVGDKIEWEKITIHRTEGEHGSGSVLEDMGRVSGFVFQAPGEPTVYWAGDTILCDAVRETVKQFRPDVIITHSSGAVWGEGTLIVMDAEQTLRVSRMAPESTVAAVHMEAFDHATVTREELRRYCENRGIGRDKLLIPADGETLEL